MPDRDDDTVLGGPELVEHVAEQIDDSAQQLALAHCVVEVDRRVAFSTHQRFDESVRGPRFAKSRRHVDTKSCGWRSAWLQLRPLWRTSFCR